ncbi:MAG: hypothetical protein AAF581_07945 [Planctomycetota bacterium]
MSFVSKTRVWRALVAKELRLVTAGRGFMLMQLVFLVAIGLTVGTLISDQVRSGADDPSAVATLAIAIFLQTAFWMLLFVVPAMTVGALQEEKERGMLEVLATTPVTVRRIFGALISARLLLVGLVAIVALPIVALPVAQSAAIPWPVVARGVVSTLLGVTLTTLFALRLVALGHGAAQTWTRVVILVVATPFAWGRSVFFKLFLCALILGIACAFTAVQQGPINDIIWVLQLLLVPFYVLGGGIVNTFEPVWLGVLWLLFAIAIVLYYRDAVRETEGWVRRQLVPDLRRQPKPRRWDEDVRRESMERLEQAHAGSTPVDAQVEGWLLARRVLNSLGPVQRFFLRHSGRSPFLVRHFLVRTSASIVAWSGALLVTSVLVYTLPFPRNPTIQMGWITSILTFAAALVIALVGSSVFPTRRSREDDPLLVTPLSGWRIVRGVVALFLFATWPLTLSGIVCVSAYLPFRPEFVSAAALNVLVLLARLTLIMGLVLWISRVWTQWAQRFGVSIVTLGLVGTGLNLLRDLSFSKMTDLAFALAIFGAGLILLCGFAISFDHLTGRARSQGRPLRL